MERIERRRRRSENHVEALLLYLEALTLRHRLQALVLADSEGFLMGWAGAWGDFEQLALLAAVGAERPARVADLLGDPGRQQRLHTSALDVDGAIFYLASVGVGSPAFEDVTGTLHRILFAPA